MHETLRRSSLGELAPTARAVNLELALRADARLGGHIMQGHVDGVGAVAGGRARTASPASSRSTPRPELLRYVVEKGSIAVDGVSLTVARVDDAGFDVSLIPETLERTTLGARRARHAGQPGGRRAGEVRREAESGARALKRRSFHAHELRQFATIEEALEDIAAGRMVVVVDDEDRENEGDLVMAAEFVTPDADQLHGHATRAAGSASR